MDRWAGKTAVVTGASAGIGAAIAVALANAGLNVVGVARRQHLVDELKSSVVGTGSLHSRQCDVSSAERVADTFGWVHATFGGTDVLVNNAAVIHHGTVTEVGPNTVSVEELMSMIDINVKSVVLCARHAARSMHERGVQGHIININSVAGHYIPTHPIFNVYTASKHAVTAITKTLHNEFSEHRAKIKTTSLSPGLVRTDMMLMRNMPHLQAFADQQPHLQPSDVADAVLYALGTPPNVNIEELTITALGEKLI